MSPRALKIGLALSLVLNIFLLTAVGGAILMRHKLMDNGRGDRPLDHTSEQGYAARKPQGHAPGPKRGSCGHHARPQDGP